MQLSFHSLSFRYEGALDPLFSDLSVVLPAGWTGVVGANGAGKSTLLQLAVGLLHPNVGAIHRPGLVVYCPQRTDSRPELLDQMLASNDRAARVVQARLGMGEDWADRWETLSHGERKRAQIAVALWQEPEVLAIDEPTNHIDADARLMLIDALSRFHGVGIIVSHDRELLDRLCERCLIVDPPDVTMRPGNYSDARAQADQDEARTVERYQGARREAARLAAEATRRVEEASRADRRKSKRGISRKDHDAKGKIDAARVSGADGNAGRLLHQLDGRLEQAQERVSEFRVRRRFETHLWLPGSRSHRNTLFVVPEGSLDLGAGRRLSYPELSMRPQDRVAVVGPNGMGKSTLLRRIVSSLDLEPDRVIYMPQEISLEESQQVMAEVNEASDERLGWIMTIVSCLGTRPGRLVGNADASPGEIRKVLLALGMSRSPYLIVMDEPTNHLDLPAIECLESALSECPCGLLLVSHDMRFLRSLTSIEWSIADDADVPGSARLVIRETGRAEP